MALSQSILESDARLIVLSAVAYLAVASLFDGLLVLPGYAVVPLSAGLAVPLGVLFGGRGAVGLAVGSVLSDAMWATVRPESLVAATALFLAATVARLAWSGSAVDVERPVTPSWLVRSYAGAAVVASLWAANWVAWGGEILALYPFFTQFHATFVTTLLATAAFGPPFVVALSRDWLGGPVAFGAGRPGTDGPGRLVLLGLPVLWGLVASVGSLGFHLGDQVVPSAFDHRNVGFLRLLLHDGFGHGGRRVQVAFGAFVVSLLAVRLSPVGRLLDRVRGVSADA